LEAPPAQFLAPVDGGERDGAVGALRSSGGGRSWWIDGGKGAVLWGFSSPVLLADEEERWERGVCEGEKRGVVQS
jgi:hypothetical protein